MTAKKRVVPGSSNPCSAYRTGVCGVTLPELRHVNDQAPPGCRGNVLFTWRRLISSTLLARFMHHRTLRRWTSKAI